MGKFNKLDLIELMLSYNSADVFPVRARLGSETRRIRRVFYRQVIFTQYFIL